MSKRKHRVLIVGAGSIGERHLRCFLNTSRAEVAFVEVQDELREKIADRYPEAIPISSLEAALEQGSEHQGQLSSAVIATPALFHVEQALLLLKKGVHVLIEKPLSLTLEGIDELVRVAEQSDQIAAVAYVYRANPILQQMRKALNSGQYGKPVELVMTGGQNFPTYRPAYRDTYYRKRETGGGAIQDALTHVVNVGQWLVEIFSVLLPMQNI